MPLSKALSGKCFYRENGVRCEGGMLFHTDNEAVLLEGTGVYCPACEGKGEIPTREGRSLLAFLLKFARPILRDVVDELFEERER